METAVHGMEGMATRLLVFLLLGFSLISSQAKGEFLRADYLYQRSTPDTGTAFAVLLPGKGIFVAASEEYKARITPDELKRSEGGVGFESAFFAYDEGGRLLKEVVLPGGKRFDLPGLGAIQIKDLRVSFNSASPGMQYVSIVDTNKKSMAVLGFLGPNDAVLSKNGENAVETLEAYTPEAGSAYAVKNGKFHLNEDVVDFMSNSPTRAGVDSPCLVQGVRFYPKNSSKGAYLGFNDVIPLKVLADNKVAALSVDGTLLILEEERTGAYTGNLSCVFSRLTF